MCVGVYEHEERGVGMWEGRSRRCVARGESVPPSLFSNSSTTKSHPPISNPMCAPDAYLDVTSRERCGRLWATTGDTGNCCRWQSWQGREREWCEVCGWCAKKSTSPSHPTSPITPPKSMSCLEPLAVSPITNVVSWCYLRVWPRDFLSCDFWHSTFSLGGKFS
jgi:hypothetical protein